MPDSRKELDFTEPVNKFERSSALRCVLADAGPDSVVASELSGSESSGL